MAGQTWPLVAWSGREVWAHWKEEAREHACAFGRKHSLSLSFVTDLLNKHLWAPTVCLLCLWRGHDGEQQIPWLPCLLGMTTYQPAHLPARSSALWSLWDTPHGAFKHFLSHLLSQRAGPGRAGTRAVKLPSAVGCAAALTQLASWKAQPCFLSGFSPRWRFLYRHLTQNMLLSVGIGPRELVAASQTLGIPASLSGPTEQRLEGQWAMCTVLGERVVANGPPSPAKCTQCPVGSVVTVHAHWGRMSPTCLIYHHNDCNQIISRLHRWMEEQVHKCIWKQQSLFVQKFGRNVDFNVGMDLF